MGLFPKNAAEYASLAGIPITGLSKVYVVDPQHGSDSNSGLSFKAPLLTLEAAEDLCVANHNDTVLLVGGPTANNIADTIAWDKSYTHLVGLSGNLGVGQRCRVVGTATTDETTVITISGNGCIFKNVQFFNGTDADTEAQAAVITGSRGYYENVFFAGMGHATSAAHIGGSSVAISGDENTFVRCVFGLAAMARTVATDEVILSGECNRNTFIKCKFQTWSNTATSSLVKFTSTAVPYTTVFEDCVFENFRSNNGAAGTALNHAIIDGATPWHQNLLVGTPLVVGCSAIVDVATYTFGAAPVPAAGQGIGCVTTT